MRGKKGAYMSRDKLLYPKMYHFKPLFFCVYDIVSYDAHTFIHIALVSDNTKSIKE